jgi:hypothetical protein
VAKRFRVQVQGGRIQLDEPYDAPDETEVDLVIVDDDLTDEERQRLHSDFEISMSEFDRGEGIAAEKVIESLRGMSSK